MKVLETTVEIDATPAMVWRVFADVERWPEWTSSVTAIERLEASTMAPGSRVRIEQPKLAPAVWTVSSWHPEKEFSWVSMRLGVVTTADHQIEERRGGCRVRVGSSVHWRDA